MKINPPARFTPLFFLNLQRRFLKASRASCNFGEESAQLPLSHRPYRINPFPLVAFKLAAGSILAPTWKRAPPVVRSSPSAPVCGELGFWLVADPAAVPTSPQPREAHARVHTHALTLPLTLPRPRSRHPTLQSRSSAGLGGGGVTSGLQSQGERLERVARSSPRKLEAHSGRRRSRAPPSPLHPLSRCPPAGERREPPGELKVVSGGGRRGCCSPGMP